MFPLLFCAFHCSVEASGCYFYSLADRRMIHTLPSSLTCGVKLLEYRYVQVWIIAKRWKQSPVGWFLESLQKT